MSRASGIGSWPGTSVREALAVVRDLLSEDGLPYLPELPARGPGADMVGRAAGLLVDLAVDLQPMGWRFVDRPGRDASRTASLWREDLDELAEAFDGYTGELKLQVAGPWTLASSVWLHRAERAVVDEGATRDLVASLAEGVRVHLGEVQRLVPGARLVLQLDEPGLPAVLAGRLPTASGYGVLRAVDPQVAAGGPSRRARRRGRAAYGDPLLRPGPELAPAAGHRRLRARGRHHAARPPRVGVGRGDGGVRGRAVGRRAAHRRQPRPVCPASSARSSTAGARWDCPSPTSTPSRSRRRAGWPGSHPSRPAAFRRWPPTPRAPSPRPPGADSTDDHHARHTPSHPRRRAPADPAARSSRVPWPAKFGALAVIWGASFFFMKIGLRSLAPLQISGLRIFSGAAVLVALLAASRGRLPRDRAVWAHLVVSAFFLCTLPFSLFALGEQRVSSALAGIGNATTPIATVVFSLLLLRGDVIGRRKVVGRPRGLPRRPGDHAAVAGPPAGPTSSASA